MPTPIPVNNPVEETIVAADKLLLLHVPPKVTSVKVEVSPTHKADVPEMAAGNGLTSIGNVVAQPVDSV